MASAWGGSWGTSWGNSWGAAGAPPVTADAGSAAWWQWYWQQLQRAPRDAVADGAVVVAYAELFHGDASSSGRALAQAVVVRASFVAGGAVPEWATSSGLAVAQAEILRVGWVISDAVASGDVVSVTASMKAGQMTTHVRVGGDVVAASAHLMAA